MSYLIRRLMENTSNTSFLRQTYAEKKAVDALIKAPAAPIRRLMRTFSAIPSSQQGFRNEPPIDFSRQANRVRFAQALEEVRGEFKNRRRLSGSVKRLESLNPANPAEIIGAVRIDDHRRRRARHRNCNTVFSAVARHTGRGARRDSCARGRSHAPAALGARRLGSFRSGQGLARSGCRCQRSDRFLRLLRAPDAPARGAARNPALPSEENVYFYEPRGVAAVIAPWNFPLAILTGMTSAALVTGNSALMKPAEQSPVMALHLIDILREAGLPARRCQLLPGGGELGAHLVGSRESSLDRVYRFARGRPAKFCAKLTRTARAKRT